MRKSVLPSHRQYTKGGSSQSNRIFLLTAFAVLLFVIIIGRLFQLQVIRHKQYIEIARNQHFGSITLPAKRGEILVRDTHSGELSKLATNTTLDLVYVDPLVAEDKIEIAKKLAPLLFTKEDYADCINLPEECPYDVEEELDLELFVPVETVWIIDDSKKVEMPQEDIEFKSYSKMIDEYAAKILRKISKSEVDFVVLRHDSDQNLMADVVNENLPGIFVNTKNFMIYADPTLIPENRLKETSKVLAPILQESSKSLGKSLSRRKVRYVFLKNKLEPEISRKIKELSIRGVVLLQEHWRYYPENSLASHVIGFLNRDEIGQYGTEGYFNTDLDGKKGTIYAERDPSGRRITVGDSEIVSAIDGDTVILTIDRIIQKRIEEILAEAVEQYKADSGQVIVMDPFTGAIIAMANYPGFNPNKYTDVFALRPLEKDELVEKTVPVFKLNEKGKYVPVIEEDLFNDEVQKYIYENKFGPSVFKNKIISEFYEPGSVFKSIVMAIALDAKEVEPQTTFIDDGPLMIDEFEIKNADGKYRGRTSMSEVLAYSMNTGMSFVAKKLGKKLMYQYLTDFGFSEYTNIKLEGETKKSVDYYKRWSKAQLLTTSFGQGIVVTPLQLVTAWASLANGGKLMQPYIVDSIIRENEVIPTEPQVIKRVISEEASSIITSMNVNSVRNGVASPADIHGYLIAGKTGTSQIAGSDGKYEEGEGSTITSFAGYAPALEPKFVMLVKFDRPRYGAESTWGSTTAAPTFKKITQFLMDYYNIQPTS